MGVIPIVALLILAIGLTLALIGWRGRRVDDHPVCRKCRFDLAGVYPAIETCPECGRDLAGRRAVRIGNRRHRRLPLGVGATLLAAALILGGLMVTVLVGGPALNPYKPVWMLGIEARSAGAGRAGDALVELMSRFDDGELSEAQVGRLVTLALDEHADDQDPNGQLWINAIENLHLAGELSDDEFARYLGQAVVLRLLARNRATLGDPVPIQVFATDARIGSGQYIVVEMEMIAATLDGEPAKFTQYAMRFSIRGRQPTGSGRSTSTRMVLSRSDIEPGLHRIDTTWSTRVRWKDGRQDAYDAPIVANWEQSKSFDVEFLEEQSVRIAKPSADDRRAMLSALTSIRAIPSLRNHNLQLELSVENPPMAGSFKVLVREAGGRGEPVQVRSSFHFAAGSGPMSYGIMLDLPLDSLVGAESIDIILRPDLESARKTVDLFEIYGEQIVLENIPITRPGG